MQQHAVEVEQFAIGPARANRGNQFRRDALLGDVGIGDVGNSGHSLNDVEPAFTRLAGQKWSKTPINAGVLIEGG
jgi:hypothetical protein